MTTMVRSRVTRDYEMSTDPGPQKNPRLEGRERESQTFWIFELRAEFLEKIPLNRYNEQIFVCSKEVVNIALLCMRRNNLDSYEKA